MKLDHKKIEKKWQEKWESEAIYWPKDMSEGKNKLYSLWMFPYPSAEGLHAGHAFASTGSDIYSRYQRMLGKTVFQPIGYDSFGIHSENFAIKIGEHPQKMLDRTTKNYANQLKSLGHGYDWTRTVTTSEVDYYKWTQWLFVEMFKSGLAYRKKAKVNWCSSCMTVLADEQVMTPTQAGKAPKDAEGNLVKGEDLLVCERCGTVIQEKKLEQWFFRITDYADKLLENLDKIDWPENIKSSQKNWIGKKEGINITYPIKGTEETVTVWTSRPDTNFGATFIVVSPEFAQKYLDKIISSDRKKTVNNYITNSLKKSKEDRISEGKEKTGEFTGLYAINQLNDYEMPIWVADFVLSDVGTGAVVGVPGHDQRDFEFAQKFNLPVKVVVKSKPKIARSYLMGGEDITDKELIDLNINIVEKTKEGYRKLEIPMQYLDKFEKLVENKMTPGYWNEYISDKIIFIFKDKNGNIERIELKDDTEQKIDKLAAEYNGQPLREGEETSVWSWLAENDWYTPYIIHEEQGIIINSEFLDGLDIYEAKQKIMDHLEEKGWGVRTTNYHLRDWLISRQRYWGPPIPMVYCGECAEKRESWFTEYLTKEDRILHKNQDDWNHYGWYPSGELPVKLPDIESFKPQSEGRGPLDDQPSFYETVCPHCNGKARRETDVSDTFLDSSWYFLAYPMQNTEVWDNNDILQPVHGSQTMRSSHNDNSGTRSLSGFSSKGAKLLENKIIESWLPVDLYFGGAEHAVLHLMYARFVTMMLNDLSYIDFDEPFPRFFAHGLMIKDGAKMSKSRGNVVNPDEYVEKFGADTLRLYLMFMGPMDGYPDFRDTGIEGMRRFVEKVWNLFHNHSDFLINDLKAKTSMNIKLHQTIKKVTIDIEKFHYNTAIAAIMELVNLMREVISEQEEVKSSQDNNSKDWESMLSNLALILAPFAPHLTEEVWNTVLGNNFSIHTQKWPVYDKEIIKEEEVEIIVQVNGKTRGTIAVDRDKSMQKETVISLTKEDHNISKWIKEKQIVNTIFVPGRIVNFVT